MDKCVDLSYVSLLICFEILHDETRHVKENLHQVSQKKMLSILFYMNFQIKTFAAEIFQQQQELQICEAENNNK